MLSGISSDSSYRFERGVDIDGVVHASQLAASLIEKLAAGSLGDLGVGFAEDSTFGVDPAAMLDEEEGQVFTRTVPLRAKRCAALLGTPISEEKNRWHSFGLRIAQDRRRLGNPILPQRSHAGG